MLQEKLEEAERQLETLGKHNVEARAEANVFRLKAT
jgi:hypothetical protein